MFKKFSLIIACLGVLFATLAATAQIRNKKTTLTFSQPVELPGIVLPAGTYVFKLADLQSSRNFVQVFNADENHIFATIMAIPHQRATRHDKTYIGFEERRAGAPEAIHEWFYPGDTNGLEFVYPKVRAQELAHESGQPVLAAEMAPSETQAELEQAPVVEVTPENKEVQVAQTYDLPERARVSAVPQQTAALEPAPAMPKTASSLPLIAVVGLFSLCIAGAMKALIRKNG